jgi:hypothetical protein
MINRRTFVAALAALLAEPVWADQTAKVITPAWRAALFAFSIGEMVRAMSAAPARNRFGHRRMLSDHTNRGVTMPNNDTLYSSCWLDLPSGAFADLDVPLNSGRYASATLTGMDTDVIACVSSAGRSSSSGKLRIVGPGWSGSVPADRKLIRLPGADAWLLVRIAVDGPQDLSDAQTVQSQLQLSITGAAVTEIVDRPTVSDKADRLRSQVNAVLARCDPAAAISRRAASHRLFGIGIDDAVDANSEAAWRAAVDLLDASGIGDITSYGNMTNGWLWPDREIACFGEHEQFRAAVALSGLGALPEREAIYLTAMLDHEGQPLQAGKGYRIALNDPPPVDAFWSLSAYRGEPDGRFYFVDNPVRRYAVGSTTLALREGGEIIATPSPPPDSSAVWLPIVDGPFRLVLRAYLPKQSLLSRCWEPPLIIPLA